MNFERHQSWEIFPDYIPLDPFDRRAEIIIIKTNIFKLQKSNKQIYYSCAKIELIWLTTDAQFFHWTFSSVALTRDALHVILLTHNYLNVYI